MFNSFLILNLYPEKSRIRTYSAICETNQDRPEINYPIYHDKLLQIAITIYNIYYHYDTKWIITLNNLFKESLKHRELEERDTNMNYNNDEIKKDENSDEDEDMRRFLRGGFGAK